MGGGLQPPCPTGQDQKHGLCPVCHWDHPARAMLGKVWGERVTAAFQQSEFVKRFSDALVR